MYPGTFPRNAIDSEMSDSTRSPVCHDSRKSAPPIDLARGFRLLSYSSYIQTEHRHTEGLLTSEAVRKFLCWPRFQRRCQSVYDPDGFLALSLGALDLGKRQ